jgi:hypothetical protein
MEKRQEPFPSTRPLCRPVGCPFEARAYQRDALVPLRRRACSRKCAPHLASALPHTSRRGSSIGLRLRLSAAAERRGSWPIDVGCKGELEEPRSLQLID